MDHDPQYGWEERVMVNSSYEYDDDRNRKKREELQAWKLGAIFGFGTMLVMIVIFNSGLLETPTKQQPRDYYYKPVRSPLNLNQTAQLTIDLNGVIIGAQSPIYANVTMYIAPQSLFRNNTDGTLFEAETYRRLPDYAQILFNGTSCGEPSTEFPHTIECWKNLDLKDDYPRAVVYSGTLIIYYTHGGDYGVTLASPITIQPTRVPINEGFIQIESVEATANFNQFRASYEQWRATVVIAGIVALFTILSMFIRFYWYLDQHPKY